MALQNIHLRGITGILYVTLMLFCALQGGYYLIGLYGLFVLFCTYEFIQIIKNKYPDFPTIPLYVSNISTFLLLTLGKTSLFDKTPQVLPLLAFIPLCFFIYSLYQKNKDAILFVALLIFGWVYIGIGLSFLVLLPYAYLASEYQAWILMSLYIIVWANDSFAYLVGRKIGKNKLFPSISPSKTWEGAIGGVVGSLLIVTGIFIAFYFGLKDGVDKINFLDSLSIFIVTILLCIAANLGDLFESLFKRFAGVKDSSALLPGHGGFLDRLDSLLFVGPLVYVLLWFLQK